MGPMFIWFDLKNVEQPVLKKKKNLNTISASTVLQYNFQALNLSIYIFFYFIFPLHYIYLKH